MIFPVLQGPSNWARWTESTSTASDRRAAQRTNSSVLFCHCEPTLGSWRGLSLTQLLLRLMGEEVDLTSLRGAWLSLTSQMGDTGDRTPHSFLLPDYPMCGLCDSIRTIVTSNHTLSDSEHASLWRPQVQSQFLWS